MLRTRVLTAIVALLLLGTVLYVLPPPAAKIVIALLVLAGAWEWAGFLGANQSVMRVVYVALIGALIALSHFRFAADAELILKIACGWWLLAFLWTFAFPTPIPMAVRWLCGVLVLVPLSVALQGLYGMRPQLLLLALLIVWAADIGAYFSGKQFGRVKLAPEISPGKTWEGVIGGLAGVAVLAFGWSVYAGHSIMVVLPFCLAVGAVSVVGDLTVSMFKRTAGVKDSGALFPGHGGVLDRVDSIAAAAPLFALGVVWFGLV